MTETQERFLRTILSRVEIGSVVELHLFPPIRRGMLETGVAVIATDVPQPPLAMVEDAAPAGDDQPTDDAAAADESADESDGQMLRAATADVVSTIEPDVMAEGWAHDAIAAAEAPPDDSASPYRLDELSSEPTAPVVAEHDLAELTAGNGQDVTEDLTTAVAAPSRRVRIHTASYRHTIKGVDRGKWTVDVQVEADAPAEAIEAVLRGVRHRSTEAADPERIATDVLAHLVAPSAVAPAA